MGTHHAGKLIAAAVVTGLAVAMPLLGSYGDSTTPKSATPLADSARATADALNALAGSVGDEVSTLYSTLDDWAGDYFDGAQLVVNIAGVVPQTLTDSLDKLASTTGLPISVSSVSYTEKNLEDLVTTINNDESAIDATGIQLEGWGIDDTTNTVNVEVRDPSPEILTKLQSLLAATDLAQGLPSPISIGQGGPSTTTSAPWYGGDRIYSDDYKLRHSQPSHVRHVL